MFTKSDELRREARVLDFVSGYSESDIEQLGSLQRVIGTLQEAQVARGVAEDRANKAEAEAQVLIDQNRQLLADNEAVSRQRKPAAKKKIVN